MRKVGMGVKQADMQAVPYEAHMEAVNEIVRLQESSAGLNAENETLKAENETLKAENEVLKAENEASTKK